MRIAEKEELNTMCVIRYGAYDWLVMPFGLTNLPTTCCTLMNKTFYPYLDQIMVVYLDDIVIYRNTLEEHAEHLKKVSGFCEKMSFTPNTKSVRCEAFCEKSCRLSPNWTISYRVRISLD